MTHFFGDTAYSRENENPTPANPVLDGAPQVGGAPANPVAIAEPTEPSGIDRNITYDENGNVVQANLNYGQTEMIPVAGGAQPHFSNDPKPDDVRRSYSPTHQPVGDLKEQAQAKIDQQANQTAAVARSEKKSTRKSAKK